MLYCWLLEKSEVPAEVASVLPAIVVSGINALLANSALNSAQKMEQIDELLKTVPDEQLEKLPQPPNYAQLPAEVRAQLKKMCHELKPKSVAEKKEAFNAYIATLPAEQQAIMMKPCGKK